MEAYDNLFELLANAQGGRMEDQRAKGPSLSGIIVRSPTTLNTKGSSNIRGRLQHNAHPAFPDKEQPGANKPRSEPSTDAPLNRPQSSCANNHGTASRCHGVALAAGTTNDTSTTATVPPGKVNGPNGYASSSRHSTHDHSGVGHAKPRSREDSIAEETAITNHTASLGSPRRALALPTEQRDQHQQQSSASQKRTHSSSVDVTPPHVAPSNSPTEGCKLDGFLWFVGHSDRKHAENMLRHWPTGAFVVRQGRSSYVITLKFPVRGDKIFFHVRITHEGPIYRIAESECFKSIPELVTFYCNNPARFFRGMSQEDRKKHQLIPYRPLPTVDLRLNDDCTQSEA